MTRAAGGGSGRRAATAAAAAAAAASAAQPAAALALLDRFTPLPRLVVFDLDYTLWPFWCEMFSPRDTPWLYAEVPAILDALEQRGVPLALASRTPTPGVANAFLDKLSLRSRFCSIQLIPASSGFDHTTAQKDTAHLPAIQRETGCAYVDMLFFDDEHKNVHRVARLGVVSVLVSTDSGVCLRSLEKGLKAFADSKLAA